MFINKIPRTLRLPNNLLDRLIQFLLMLIKDHFLNHHRLLVLFDHIIILIIVEALHRAQYSENKKRLPVRG